MRTATPPCGMAKPRTKRAGTRRSRMLTSPHNHTTVAGISQNGGLQVKKLALIAGLLMASHASAQTINPVQDLLRMFCSEYNEITDPDSFVGAQDMSGRYMIFGMVKGFIWGFARASDTSIDLENLGARVGALCLQKPESRVLTVLEILAIKEEALPAYALREENKLLKSSNSQAPCPIGLRGFVPSEPCDDLRW